MLLLPFASSVVFLRYAHANFFSNLESYFTEVVRLETCN